MSIGWIFVAVPAVLALAALYATGRPSRWRWLPAGLLLAGAVAAAGWSVRAAETPFGVGNGVVPELVGRSACASVTALYERGLRWRYRSEATVYRHRPDCEDMGDSITRKPRGRAPAWTITASWYSARNATSWIRASPPICDPRGCQSQRVRWDPRGGAVR